MSNNFFKGYSNIVKAVVVSLDDPEELNRVQVWIPSYYQLLSNYKKITVDKDGVSYTYYYGLPWAQVSSPLIDTDASSVLSSFFRKESKPAKPILPSVNDIIWVMFENGDVTNPVYMGALTTGTDTNLTFNPPLVLGGDLASAIVSLYLSTKLSSYTNLIYIDPNKTPKSIEKVGLLRWKEAEVGTLINNCSYIDATETKNLLGDTAYEYFADKTSWRGFSVSETNDIGKGLVNLLSSDLSKTSQNKMAISLADNLLNDVRLLDITGSAFAVITLLHFYNTSIYEVMYPAVKSSAHSLNKASSKDANELYKKLLAKQEWSETIRGDIDTLYVAIATAANTGKLCSAVDIEGTSSINLPLIPGVSVTIDSNFILDGSSSGNGGSAANSNSRFQIPWIVPSHRTISAQYGSDYGGPNTGYSDHRGIDISTSQTRGSYAIAPCKAIVCHTQTVGAGDYIMDWSYGNACELRVIDSSVVPQDLIDKGVFLRYGHFEKLLVSEGEEVTAGTNIGMIGTTGHSTGIHLHFEVLLNYYENANAKGVAWTGHQDPENYLVNATVDEFYSTPRVTSANGATQRILNNIDNSTTIYSAKKLACKTVAKELLDLGYETAFVAGVLSNLCHEGNTGLFEHYNVNTDYHPNLNNYLQTYYNTTYTDMFSGKCIYNMNLTTVYTIFTDLNNRGWTYNNVRIGTGLGCVGWTFGRAYTLINIYREVTNNGNFITENQALAAEGLMVSRELGGSYKNVYTTWKNSNASNLNSQAAAYNAAYDVCIKYERPADTEKQAVTRGNFAKSVYNDLIK